MNKQLVIRILLIVLPLLFLASGVLAASSANYAVDWQTLSAGGAPAASSSGQVTLNGSLGQAAIGPSAGSHSSLWAGFWIRVRQAMIKIFLPTVLR